MASKRHLRSKMCGEKQRDASYAAAEADRGPRRQNLHADGCRFCGGIPLGHPTGEARQRLAFKQGERRKTLKAIRS